MYTNPPDELEKLVNMYNSTFEKIWDNHDPIQIKQVLVQHQTKWYNKDIASAKSQKER